MNHQRTDPLTARSLLFGNSPRDSDAMGAALRTLGVTALVATGLVGLSPYAQRFAQTEVKRALNHLLDVDAGHAIARAWSKHRQLASARHRTRNTPTRELVELAAHDVASDHRLHIDVVVDRVPRQRVDAELALRMRLKAMVATISGGRVVALRGGDAEVTGQLTVLGVTVVKHRRELASSVVLASALERPDDQEPRSLSAA